MAKSDIIASLKLNSTDYEQKLAKAKESTRKFTKDGGAGLTDMMGKFTKLAGAVAASKVAMEVFNRVVASSQTIGDAYAVSMAKARGSVDEFVYAIANADFSGFNNGLRGIMENAKEAAASMDALGNAQISYDYLTAGYRSNFKTNIATAKDKSLTKEERDAAYSAAKGSLSSMEKAVAGYTDKIVRAVVDNAVAKANNINRDYVTRENIDRILALDLMPGGDAEKERLKAIYDQYKDIREQQMAYHREAQKYADKLNNGEQYTRNPLTGNMELNLFKAAQLQRRRDEAQAEADRLNAMVATNAEYQQAALYNAMLVKGTDEWLKEMTSLIIKADNAKASLAEMQTATYEIANQLNQPVKPGTIGEIISTSRYKPQGLGAMAGIGTGSSASALPVTLEAVKPVILYAEAYKVLEETSLSASEGLGAISSAMGSLSGVMGEGAAAWMNYAGNIVSAVSSALPALENLAAAQAAAAALGAALNPWTAAAGVAAIVSIGAALAQLPKFATGGVVPGNALSGDNVLIRANSGEVVLTKQQANNIGSALAGFGGNVRFVIEGDKLVGVLNNHNRITSRSYGN